MPQIQRAGISGCCVGSYYYDLGGAHSKYRSKNIEEFALKMVDLGMNKVNVAITNSVQGPERMFLEELGFKEVFKADNMYVHCVSSKTLTEALKPYNEIKQRKVKEEQERKRKEELKRQEEARKRAEAQRLARLEKEKAELAKIPRVTSNEDVTMAWIHEQYKRYPNVSVQGLFNTLFGFKKMPDYERKWDDEDVLRSINSRLRRRREIAKAGA